MQLYLKHGAPSLRPFPAALKAYFGHVAISTDCQYLLLSFMFLQMRPMALVSIP
jgi:hypothetical protein